MLYLLSSISISVHLSVLLKRGVSTKNLLALISTPGARSNLTVIKKWLTDLLQSFS